MIAGCFLRTGNFDDNPVSDTFQDYGDESQLAAFQAICNLYNAKIQWLTFGISWALWEFRQSLLPPTQFDPAPANSYSEVRAVTPAPTPDV